MLLSLITSQLNNKNTHKNAIKAQRTEAHINRVKIHSSPRTQQEKKIGHENRRRWAKHDVGKLSFSANFPAQ